MKIFIWENIKGVSNNYHDGGGLLIIAESLKRAEEIAVFYSEKYSYETKTYKEFKNKINLLNKENEIIKPDHEFETSFSEEKVITFPDAGCC